MTRYIITAHAHLDGVALSCPGQFGGQRFPDDAAAVAHARELAGTGPLTIERESVRARRAPR